MLRNPRAPWVAGRLRLDESLGQTLRLASICPAAFFPGCRNETLIHWFPYYVCWSLCLKNNIETIEKLAFCNGYPLSRI